MPSLIALDVPLLEPCESFAFAVKSYLETKPDVDGLVTGVPELYMVCISESVRTSLYT